GCMVGAVLLAGGLVSGAASSPAPTVKECAIELNAAPSLAPASAGPAPLLNHALLCGAVSPLVGVPGNLPWTTLLTASDRQIEAYFAGLEYVRYAGLDEAAYNSFVSSGSWDPLRGYLYQTPLAGPDDPSADVGYCHYKAPENSQGVEYEIPQGFQCRTFCAIY